MSGIKVWGRSSTGERGFPLVVLAKNRSEPTRKSSSESENETPKFDTFIRFLTQPPSVFLSYSVCKVSKNLICEGFC